VRVAHPLPRCGQALAAEEQFASAARPQKSRRRWAGDAAAEYSEVISTGVHDPLYAKALVLSQGDNRSGSGKQRPVFRPRELTDSARKRASQQTGIRWQHHRRRHHTHGGSGILRPVRDALHAAPSRKTRQGPPRTIDYQSLLVGAGPR